jgi:hypothetical protein
MRCRRRSLRRGEREKKLNARAQGHKGRGELNRRDTEGKNPLLNPPPQAREETKQKAGREELRPAFFVGEGGELNRRDKIERINHRVIMK